MRARATTSPPRPTASGRQDPVVRVNEDDDPLTIATSSRSSKGQAPTSTASCCPRQSAAQVTGLDLLITQIEQTVGLAVDASASRRGSRTRGPVEIDAIAAASQRLETLTSDPPTMASINMKSLVAGEQPGYDIGDAFHYVHAHPDGRSRQRPARSTARTPDPRHRGFAESPDEAQRWGSTGSGCCIPVRLSGERGVFACAERL